MYACVLMHRCVGVISLCHRYLVPTNNTVNSNKSVDKRKKNKNKISHCVCKNSFVNFNHFMNWSIYSSCFHRSIRFVSFFNFHLYLQFDVHTFISYKIHSVIGNQNSHTDGFTMFKLTSVYGCLDKRSVWQIWRTHTNTHNHEHTHREIYMFDHFFLQHYKSTKA